MFLENHNATVQTDYDVTRQTDASTGLVRLQQWRDSLIGERL